MIQVAQLPIDDLMNACQTNVQLSVICRDPIFWKMKLQADFPGVDIRVTDPKALYLNLLEERAKQQLAKKLETIHFVVGSSQEDFDLDLHHFLGSEEYNSLSQPLPGLYKLIIYYQLGGVEPHRMEYRTTKSITPMEVLISINQFYLQPLGFVQGKEFRLFSNATIGDILGYENFIQMFYPFNEGFTFDLTD